MNTNTPFAYQSFPKRIASFESMLRRPPTRNYFHADLQDELYSQVPVDEQLEIEMFAPYLRAILSRRDPTHAESHGPMAPLPIAIPGEHAATALSAAAIAAAAQFNVVVLEPLAPPVVAPEEPAAVPRSTRSLASNIRRDVNSAQYDAHMELVERSGERSRDCFGQVQVYNSRTGSSRITLNINVGQSESEHCNDVASQVR